MHSDLYATSYDVTYDNAETYLTALATANEQGGVNPTTAEYMGAYELCSYYVGYELVNATVVATYLFDALGNYRLNPIRQYKIQSVSELLGRGRNEPGADAVPVAYMTTPEAVIIDRVQPQLLTLTYTDIVPQIVSNAIHRQASVFSGRVDADPPEYGGLDLSGYRSAQNSQYLGGLANDVRAMLSNFRLLSF